MSKLAEICRSWNLTVVCSPTKTEEGEVVFVKRGSDQFVLKIVRSDGDYRARTLRQFEGCGVVTLIKNDSTALLLEHIAPGTPLSADDNNTAVYVHVIRCLKKARKPGCHFRSVADLYAKLQSNTSDNKLVCLAKEISSDLISTQTEFRLLHGDLHEGNILFSAKRGWVAIDPHGVVGETALEAAAAFRNLTTKTELQRRLELLSEHLAVDRYRLLGWIFVQSVLIGLWARSKGFDYAPTFIQRAKLTQKMLGECAETRGLWKI